MAARLTARLTPSESSDALGALLAGSPEITDRLVAAGIHRTELWRYCTGRVTPSAERAALIERVVREAAGVGGSAAIDRAVEDAARAAQIERVVRMTGGGVPANGWTPYASQASQDAAVTRAGDVDTDSVPPGGPRAA